MKVVNNRLLIIPDSPKTTSKGGIDLPETATEKPKSGIIRLTSDTENYPEGAKVWFPSYLADTEIEVEFVAEPLKKYLIIPIKEIWLIQ